MSKPEGDVHLKIPNLDSILEQMEDKDLSSHLIRSKNYTDIIHLFHETATFDEKTTCRLLAICVKDLIDDLQYSSSALMIISLILKKIKEEKCKCPTLLLIPSAYTVLKIIKKMLTKPLLRKLSVETLLLYPDTTLIHLVSKKSEDVIDLIDYQCYITTCENQSEITEKMCSIIIRLLHILPTEIKQTFVHRAVHVWFRSIIPGVMNSAVENPESLKHNMPALELLMKSLKSIDYSDHVLWQKLLTDICDNNRYPKILKKLLEMRNDCWHRLWMFFITLLKEQITKVNKSSVSPINAMLPVVELAFKMDTKSRCQAFECWNNLIDNLSTELNEALLHKRLKLLMIPLKLNNAKVEEVILAKINTWLHLIRRFHSTMDKLTDTVLVPFLNFLFGKVNTAKSIDEKVVVSTAELFPGVSQKCIEVMVDIFSCNGCSLPRCGGRLITTKLLVEHWSLWMQCLYITFKCAAPVMTHDDSICIEQIRCVWKGFVMVIAELPENQIRADLSIEMLKFVESLFKVCQENNQMAHIIMNVLLKLLLEDHPKIRPLLKSKTSEGGPIHVFLRIVQNAVFLDLYCQPASVVNLDKGLTLLKPITDLTMDTSLADPDDVIQWLLKNIVTTAPGQLLWASMADSIYGSKHSLKQSSLYDMLLWPMKSKYLQEKINIEGLWYKWYALYCYAHPLMKCDDLDKEIEGILTGSLTEQTNDSSCLRFLSIALLKQTLLNNNTEAYERLAHIVLKVMTQSQDYEFNEKDQYWPIFADTLILLLNKITGTVNISLAETTCQILLNINSLIHIEIVEGKLVGPKPLFIETLQNGAKTVLEKLNKIDAYANLRPTIQSALNKIRKCSVTESTTSAKANTSIEVVNLDEDKADEPTKRSESKQDSMKNNFTTPGTKVPKKNKKKEPNIVNTVVENGEEYAVIKSNWKFNPKKLTEHQKEKLKRKREDIPALYQDLSQSQDEFKLTTWKTDSQDASTTTSSKSESNSKSANDNVTAILNTLPSTEILPKIIENIFTDSSKIYTDKSDDKVDNDNNNKLQKTSTAKRPNTPRLALKDRVFRNVRNLIEKSGNLQSNEKSTTTQLVEDMNQTVNENNLKTPVSKANSISKEVNSAPPKILSERPTRSVKKPKKFEDVEVYALKKKRRLSYKDQEADKTLENETNKNTVSSEAYDCDEELHSHVENSQALPENSNQESEGTDKTNDIMVAKSNLHTEENREQLPTVNDNNGSQFIEEIATTRPDNTEKKQEVQTTRKKKNSRLEKQLLIDMVEGHPLLQQSQSEKRNTRKNMTTENYSVSKRRKSSTGLVSIQRKEKSKPVSKSISPKSMKQKLTDSNSQTVTIIDSQDEFSQSQKDIPMSEDVIESSQDSTLTTISVKSASKKKLPLVRLDIENPLAKCKTSNIQRLVEEFNADIRPFNNTLNDSNHSKDDIELSKNKTMPEVSAEDLTENIDTEPMDSSGEVILINDEVAPPIVISTEETVVGKETQEIAEADTLPMNMTPVDSSALPVNIDSEVTDSMNKTVSTESEASKSDNDITNVTTQDVTSSLSKTAEAITDIIAESSNTGSPFKDEIERKKDFLNNTIEISPIKTLSPVREKKSPSPETSSDYVVIKLTSPVQSNGEPYIEKCDSPEIFTEDKISPDKRDQSPPRKEVTPVNSSPSSSLSLKKNRPEMRFNGRAGQMLGLCVPEKLQILNSDVNENDDGKKINPINTPARRNLKRFYNSSENNENAEKESEESENFLKFTRALPTADCSPSNPILKRKLVEIADEATISPASKRKRVSFHDPPVSTTVAIQKYIEPCGIRSPSNSGLKRQERQVRALTNAKSSKRLDNMFRLETVLTKAIESFDDTVIVSNETEMSLDETPAAELVKTSELNDTDPICPELLDCKDPIETIAGELSSPSTKALLIKELEGKVETISDLAKMTELEVNRLCIKAPKVKVAKKALTKYASDKAKTSESTSIQEDVNIEESSLPIPVEVEKVHIEIQTNEVLTKSSEMQTEELSTAMVDTQTDALPITHCGAQTEESGSKSTKDIIKTCLSERPDFVQKLSMQLNESQVSQISESLSLEACLYLLLIKMTVSNSSKVLQAVMSQISKYDIKKDDCKDLNSVCIQLLQKIHGKLFD